MSSVLALIDKASDGLSRKSQQVTVALLKHSEQGRPPLGIKRFCTSALMKPNRGSNQSSEAIVTALTIRRERMGPARPGHPENLLNARLLFDSMTP
jgi:hypothetical protein